MKRISIFLLTAVILMGLLMPMRTQAATMDSKAGTVTTATGPLNVRSDASTGGKILTSLKKGSYVTLIAQSGSWWQVEYAKGKYGYCHADYITVSGASPAAVTTRSDPLNVRSGAGTTYARIDSLAKGEAVLRLSTSDGWSRILYHGTKVGYVSDRYLRAQMESNFAVSLNIPSFKQTDARWADVKIGTSGKRMAQIGCATTAIAMMESYRTDTVIYPDAMSRQLSYTSSGNVYWPSHYIAVTDSTDYLRKIYQQLNAGKPVLFGAKNSYGSQHWVVITGFTGGSLNAANFTIHDPGSNSRTTLQQFLTTYPTFYKYFYY